jgi:DNA processing protein
MDERGFLDLIIARLPGLSTVERLRLTESFSQETDLIQTTKEGVEQILGRSLKIFWDIDLIRLLAERDAKTAGLRGINWVSWMNPAYPPLLREIYDPPVVLFFRGRLPNSTAPLIAIVGTRHPSPQAAAQAFEIAKELGQRGISVVSGLALGIDAMAHRGNLESDAPAYAVLGSGADEVYPSVNRVLAKRILESGGALISEYPPGTGPRKWNFPARNRIISGLSGGVIVVEAPKKSGSLITAEFALEQGRELWVASSGTADGKPALYDRRGTVKLVEDGAELVVSAIDILNKWNWQIEPPGNMEDQSGEKNLAVSLAHELGIVL